MLVGSTEKMGGSIPARAGEPPVPPPSAATGPGSIPARAGEPLPAKLIAQVREVYPRACGGTHKTQEQNASLTGLSPRVRGNRRPGSNRQATPGSIPARAGEPSTAIPACSTSGVYPRACGGTARHIQPSSGLYGLSPRVRGNRHRDYPGETWSRSIPARAGEPATEPPPQKSGRVYPRACGGTFCVSSLAVLASGLSPRVRGNQQRERYRYGRRRSIPARAGEP